MGLVVAWLFFVFLGCVVCGAIAGSIASKRGSSYGGYFALGFFFGLIGVVAAAFAGNGGRSGGTTVINNYYTVGADGSHTLLSSGPPPLRSPAATGGGRACRTPGCAAAGRPTFNDRCLVCHEATHAVGAAGSVRGRPVTSRRDLETKACANELCPEHGVRTSNLVCRACRRDTVLGWTVDAPAVAAAPRHTPAVALAKPLPPISARSHGPAHLLTRRCGNAGCDRSTVLTSDVVCRGCRRDTVLAATV